jgi:hypothetical protein
VEAYVKSIQEESPRKLGGVERDTHDGGKPREPGPSILEIFAAFAATSFEA